jgi:hypothetical protein
VPSKIKSGNGNLDFMPSSLTKNHPLTVPLCHLQNSLLALAVIPQKIGG